MSKRFIEIILDPDEKKEQMLSKLDEIKDYTEDRKCSDCAFVKICKDCFNGCPGDW